MDKMFKLIKNDEKALRRKCDGVQMSDGLLIAQTLQNWAEWWNGWSDTKAVGIAAPQLGILRKVCLTLINGEVLAFLNPRITFESGEKKSVEGCLSFPRKEFKTCRFHTIVVESDNWKYEKVFTGYNAVVTAHEISHLYGLLAWDFQEKLVPFKDWENYAEQLRQKHA